jgi:hypothetical protein
MGCLRGPRRLVYIFQNERQDCKTGTVRRWILVDKRRMNGGGKRG